MIAVFQLQRGVEPKLLSSLDFPFGLGHLGNRAKSWIGLAAVAAFALTGQAQIQPLLVTKIITVPNSSIVTGGGLVVVNWTGGTAPFQVQCCTNFGGNWQYVDGITSGSSQTNILTAPSAYYRVMGVAAVMAASPDKTAPTVPTGLAPTTASSTQINLTWNGSVDPGTNASGVKGYNVYRNGIFLQQVAAPGTATVDTGLMPSKTFNYAVSAVDNAYNQSAKSASASASTPASGNCTFVISPLNAAFPSAGGGSNFTVSAGAGCSWMAISGASWITITSGASKTGNGTVSFSLSANTNYIGRTNTLTIAAQAVTVTQAAAADTTPPSVTLTNPPGGSMVSKTITLAATASDNVGVTMVQFYRDGTNLLATDTAAPYSTNIDTTTLTNGSHFFYAKAYDAAGNTALSATNAVTVNNVTVSPLSLAFAWAGSSSNLTVTAAPTINWTASIGAAWITITSGSSGTGNGAVAFSVAGNTNNIGRTNTLTVAGQAVAVTQAADATLPSVTLTNPPSGSEVSNTISLAATASDNAGVTQVQFYRDGGTLVGTVTATPYSVSFDTSTISNGSHYFSALAYDGAGNSAMSASNTVAVSNVVVVVTNVPGQLQWVRDMMANNRVIPAGVAVDHANNPIVVGAFDQPANFGGGIVAIPNKSTSGNYSFSSFIAKYTPQNALLWVKAFGVPLNRIWSVAVDSTNNIIVTGYFTGTVDFGGVSLTAYDPHNSGVEDIFLAKYDPSGNLVWVKQFGDMTAGTQNAVGTSVAVDSSNNIYLTGNFYGTNYFGTNASGTAVTLTSSATGPGIALVKLSGVTGVTLWAKAYGSSSNDTPNSVAVDNSGNVLVTGSIAGPSNLGGGTTANGGLFIAKYSGTDGSYIWALAPSTSASAGNGIATDPNTANVFVTGSFTGSINLGGGSVTTPYNGQGGFFVAAYNSSGNYLWAHVYGANADTGNAIAVDGSGNLALMGTAGGYCLFDDAGDAINGNGFLVASFTTSGNFRWAVRSSNVVYGYGYGVGFDQLGHVLAAGAFTGTVNFGGTSVTASGSLDGFLAQYAK